MGLCAGLRAMTAPAATAWAVHLGWWTPQSQLAWIGTMHAVVVVTVLALLELVADKLPNTPPRTAAPGLIARIVMGGLAGACIGSAVPVTGTLGAVLGVAGSLIGCFGGYRARVDLVRTLGTRDFVVAVVEDAIAIAASVWVVRESDAPKEERRWRESPAPAREARAGLS
jgi:uncharacterized membrane protein